jgi:uncharacterized surface protein with fasciclin (FAS1) repeats
MIRLIGGNFLLKIKKILPPILMLVLFMMLAVTPLAYAVDQSIVDIAISEPSFSTLVTALTAADLVSALQAPGPYTVFAPTNDAFAALPIGVLQYLLSDIGALSEVLTYHVVSGKAISSDLTDNQALTTLLGETLTVKIGADVLINDAKVTMPNVEASNGVIHVIDKVLVPQSVLNRVATVNIASASGGTTQPTGTSTYPFGTTVTVTADPDSSHVFQNWVISQSGSSNDIVIAENPLSIAAAGQVTITPIFVVPEPIPGRPLPPDLSNSAIVEVLSSAGGTTIPGPGTYALANAEKFDLIAMPNNGWQFSHWTICGFDTGHGTSPTNWNPTDNPYNVNHGYGATFTYQAIFVPIGTSEPTPTPTATPGGTIGGMSTETWIIIALVVVIVVILIGFGVFASRKK